MNSALSSILEVAAIVLNPSYFKTNIAILPTPPAAPVTIIGPISGFYSPLSNFQIAYAAVIPAVPNIILSFKVIFSGNFTNQSPGTRTYYPNPPSQFIPNSNPVIITLSPAFHFLFVEC